MGSDQVPEGYKQTEVGVIPEDWEVKCLPEVSWFQEGPGLRNWQFTTSGMKVINVTNLENGVLNLDRTDRHISIKEFLKIYSHFSIDADDIVIASSGNSYCKTAIARDCDLPLVMNTSVIRFKPINGFSYSFLLEYIKSDFFKDQIDLMITGGAQPNFGPYHLKKIRLPFPPSKEQKTIAQALSDVDTLIASLDKLIAKQRQLKTAAMQQLLTGKMHLPGFGESKGYKQTEVGLIPEDWNISKLKLIAPLQRGFDLPTSKIKKGEYPVVYSNGVMNYHSRFMVNGPGVVTGRSGTIGNVHYVSENYWPHNTALWVTDFIDSHPKYVYYLYLYLKLERFGTGSGVPTLNRNDVHDLEVAIPQLEEQRAIATVLSDMDEAIAALENRRTKTQAIKQGMMQELLTGRTRLV